MTNVVQIASKMYECRDTARRLLGDKYTDRMLEIGQVIESLAKKEACSNLEAGQRIAKTGGSMVAILVIAATVELIDHSNAKNRGEEE